MSIFWDNDQAWSEPAFEGLVILNEWEHMDRVILKGEVLGLGSIGNCAFLDLRVVFLFDDWLATIFNLFMSFSFTSRIALESIVLSKNLLFNLLLSSLNKLFLNNRTDDF